ncbi:ABC transporter permease [Botrimarina mediterranea]|uniref:Dipeptide transport system permease protein DppB n=1 Tax=Botrimarina mediterranea TaxID=2528022 RepID=A0A518KEG1_9BACT|nr:ABC transporter permease [Botrimarina mediterranea]QDV76182.1 Dipeptide transport system permease protein DppB [Botrimarina mediterranea]QDV80779.1 Dipeptide transport system permease protein DppB [Planctomycetes bacterium K2D]
MVNYLLRRLGIGLLTLWMVTFVVYALVRHMPGTPLTVDQGNMHVGRQMSPEAIEQLKKVYGIDQPWYLGYWRWLGNVLQGDFGRSIPKNNKPVLKLITERAPATLLLSVTSLVLAYALSIPLGVWSASADGTVAERSVSTLLYALYSLPSFVAALYLQLLFYVRLGWLPLYGMTSDGFVSMTTAEKAWDILLHSVMPIACFTYGSLAYYSRFVRANLQEVVRQDYIRTARAKGAGPKRVLWRHAFPNTLIPLVTLLGLTLPSLLSGAVILEQIFVWPGMGRLFFESISQRDYDTLMGLTLMFSVLVLVGQLLADILYAVVDPRVTYS